MYTSLTWIEWLERLDRVLTGARQDVAVMARAVSPRGLAAIERSKRQLGALTNDLRFLDRNVVSADAIGARSDVADNLRRALDTAVFHLGSIHDIQSPTAPAFRDRVVAAVDAALRDVVYEAAVLLSPRRRLA